MSTAVTLRDLDQIREHLRNQSFLYDSPDAYEAGTDAVIEALREVASTPIDRSHLAGENAGAVGAPGLVLYLEDAEVTAR